MPIGIAEKLVDDPNQAWKLGVTIAARLLAGGKDFLRV
jgi:hypothetical protein